MRDGNHKNEIWSLTGLRNLFFGVPPSSSSQRREKGSQVTKVCCNQHQHASRIWEDWHRPTGSTLNWQHTQQSVILFHEGKVASPIKFRMEYAPLSSKNKTTKPNKNNLPLKSSPLLAINRFFTLAYKARQDSIAWIPSQRELLWEELLERDGRPREGRLSKQEKPHPAAYVQQCHPILWDVQTFTSMPIASQVALQRGGARNLSEASPACSQNVHL